MSYQEPVAVTVTHGMPDTVIYMKHCGVCGDDLYGPLSLDACPDCRQWAQTQEVIVIDDLEPLVARERAHRATFPNHPINPRRKEVAQVFGASLTVFLVGCLMAAALLLTGCDNSEWRAQQWEINDKLCARHGSAVRQERVGCGFGCANTMVTCADGLQITRR